MAEPMSLTDVGHYLNVIGRASASDHERQSDVPRTDKRAAAALEPRQGRAMGRAALVGYTTVEEPAVVDCSTCCW
jgi:hypothetical protein